MIYVYTEVGYHGRWKINAKGSPMWGDGGGLTPPYRLKFSKIPPKSELAQKLSRHHSKMMVSRENIPKSVKNQGQPGKVPEIACLA